MTKGSTVAELAKALAAEQGSSIAHTPAASEIPTASALDEAEAEFDAELDLFRDQAIAPPKRRPGRPIGANDRSTVQLAAWMRAKGYRDPAEFLAALVTADAVDLWKQLREGESDKAPLTVFDVAKLQVQAARELMPFIHRKRPIEVEHTGDGARPLIIVAGSDAAAMRRADGSMSIYDGEGNQTLINAVASGSHDRGSHDEG